MEQAIWTGIGTAAAALTSFGFVPQVWRMWRRHSVGDVSPWTLGQFALGTCLWAGYGVHIGDAVLIVANLVTLATLMVGLGLYVRFCRHLPAVRGQDTAERPALP